MMFSVSKSLRRSRVTRANMVLKPPTELILSRPLARGLLPPAALLGRHLRPLLPGLRQADRDRLRPALHLATPPALAAPERASLPPTHGALHPLAGCLAVFPPAGFPG